MVRTERAGCLDGALAGMYGPRMSIASSLLTRGRVAGVTAALVGVVAAACGSTTPPEAAPGTPMNPPKENALLDDFMNPPKPTSTPARPTTCW